MSSSAGKKPNVILDTAQPGGVGPITSSNNMLISAIFTLADLTKASIQIISDGGAVINYMFQVTNLPKNIIEQGHYLLGQPRRDDSYSSTHWSTITSNGQLTTTSPSAIVTLAESCHADGRLLLSYDSSNSSGASAQIFAVVKALGYNN